MAKRIHEVPRVTTAADDDLLFVGDPSDGSLSAIERADLTDQLVSFATNTSAKTGTATNEAMTPATTRAVTPFLDVRWYGATGNGSTDDTTALQAAINDAVTRGWTLYAPGGTYLITSALSVTGPLTLAGDGPFRTRIRNNSTTADFFTATNVLFITIRGVEFDSTVTRTSGCLFNFSNVDHVRLENLRIVDPFKAGDFNGCDIVHIVDAYLIHGGRGFNRGFWFQSCVAVTIQRMVSNMGIQTVSNPQLQVDSGIDTFMMSDSVIACQAGQGGEAEAIAFTHSLSPGSFAPRWIRLSNVYVESGTTKPGMRVDAALSLYVSNGYFTSSNRGVNIEAGVDVRFSQCLFTNNQNEGVRLGVTGTVDVASFDGCTFSDNSQATTNTTDGAIVGGITGSASFTDCYFGDAVIGATKKQRYGIYLSSPRVSIIRPTFGTNTTGRVGGTEFPAVMIEGDTTNRKLTFYDTSLSWETNQVLATAHKLHVNGELEVDGALNHDGTTVGFYGVTPVARSSTYTATNVTTDRTYDANTTTLDEVADVLGTLIADLKATGLIG